MISEKFDKNIVLVVADFLDTRRLNLPIQNMINLGVPAENIVCFVSAFGNKPVRYIVSEPRRYQDFILRELPKQEEILEGRTHVLIFQHDGFILNPGAWDDKWLKYDYIGAPWYWRPRLSNGNINVGNGGFCIRSVRFLKEAAKVVEEYPPQGENKHFEDRYLCEDVRNILEDRGLLFAPLEEAEKFSVEIRGYSNQFGFHNWETLFRSR